jgi:hypothetical protein
MSSQSKGGGSSASKSYNFNGSIACLVCSGPVDFLDGIEVDDELAYTASISRSTSANPAVISIPGRGTIRFYWGTEDQLTTDPLLISGGNDQAHNHPAYPGICYAVIDRFLFGLERTSAPNIRFRVRRKPKQSVITGAAAELVDGQANPFAVIIELFTSERFGRGRPASDFSAPHWQAAADAAYARSNECYVSVHMDRQVNGLTYARDLMSLCDGFLRMLSGTTMCEAGLFPKPETVNPGSLTLIDSSAITTRPDWTPESWEDVITRVTASYTDRDQNYKQLSTRYDDPRARTVLGESRSIDLERRFIARADQAKNHCIEVCRRLSLPGLIGTISVRQPRAALVRPGQHVRLDIDPEPGGLRLEQVCRVHSINRSATGSASIHVESERTLAPVAFVEPTIPEGPIDQTVPDITHVRLFEVPPPLVDGRDFHVGILAERPGALVTECASLYDTEDDTDSTFPPLGAHRAYAVRARLTDSYGASSTGLAELEIEVLSPFDRELIAQNPGLVAARDDTLLLIAFSAPDTSGGGYRLPYEIFSISELVSTGPNFLNVTALRKRIGTAPIAHAINTECWIIPRQSLPIYTHQDFKPKASNAALCYFKLQPATFFAVRPLADVAVRSFKFDTTRAYAPKITINTPVNDAGKDYVSLATNGSLTFSGEVVDLDGNLVAVRIFRTNPDASQQMLFSRSLTGVGSTSFSQAGTFPVDGNSIITFEAEDSNQRVVQKQMRIAVGAAISGKLSAPKNDGMYFLYNYDYDLQVYLYDIQFHYAYPETSPLGSNLRIQAIITDTGITDITGYPINYTGTPPGMATFYSQPELSMRVWARTIDLNAIYTASDWVFWDTYGYFQ